MRSAIFWVTYFILSLGLAGCEENQPQTQIPFALVDETINLNNFEFLALKTIGGYVTYDAGVRGIIIYRESASVYKVFERNCTFQPLDNCARINIDDSGLFLIDPCCQSKFSFLGNPFEGPAYIPLLEYRTTLDNNYLIITN